jgi:HEAT repeat protein
MRRRLLVLFVVAFVLTLGAVAFFSLRGEREPEYNGWKLSEYVEAHLSPLSSHHNLRGPAGAKAVRHIGTNALPCLIRWTLYEEPRWQSWADRELPSRLADCIHFVDANERRSKGVTGFYMLGEIASPAIPALTAAICDPARSPDSREAAVEALGWVGKDAVPALIEIISANQHTDTSAALLAIRQFWRIDDFGTNRNQAGRMLRTCLSHHDPIIESEAALALSALRLEPNLSVPALIGCLQDPSFRIHAAYALAQFGPDAKAALPILIPWLTNSDEHVRTAATNALANIAPESNAEAPVLRSRTAEGGQRTQG